jgi:nitrogen fixation protein NifU and related proteins
MDRQAIIDNLLDHYERPRHYGALADASIVVPGGIPDCGDRVTFYVKTDAAGEHIEQLRFEGQGCTISMAAASILSELFEGSSLERVARFTDSELLDLLGREVVQSRPRCATLAFGTLKTAVHLLERGKQEQGKHRDESVG